MLLRTWMVAWKEMLQIRRDPRTLAVVFVIPILMLLLYGYGINLDVRRVALAVYDQDRSRESRDLIASFTNNEYFRLAAYLDSMGEAGDALDRNRAKAVLVIPVDYAEELASGRRPAVQVLVDGSDSTSASTAIGYAEAIVQQHSARITFDALRRSGAAPREAAPPVDARPRFWYNPELKSSHFIIPGLIALLLTMLAALLTSTTVVRERERGTIEQLLVSPLRPIELMLGKLIPYVLIAFADVVTILVASVLIFGVPLRGSPALVLALAGVFLTAALGVGLLISTVAQNQAFAVTVAVVATQLPSVLLSGFIFPTSSMPPAIQAISAAIPATHFIRVLRGIFLKGLGLRDLWPQALILLLFGVGLLTLSSLRFRKKL